MSQENPETHKVVQGKCPICSAARVHAYRPFCSKRCKEIDLNRWVKGIYAIPVNAEDEDEDTE